MELNACALFFILFSCTAVFSLPYGFPVLKNESNLPAVIQHGPCSQMRCRNGGTCEERYGNAVCVCTDNYVGDDCWLQKEQACYDYVPLCTTTGGTCLAYGNAKREDVVCNCPANVIYKKHTGCKNKCSSIKCQNGGKCGIKNGKAVCFCNERFAGDFCSIDKCSSIMCPNNGKCGIKDGRAVCSCNERSEGDFCEFDKCSKINCQNGGKCDIKNGNAVCACSDGYFGDFCELDKCSQIKCINGGKCRLQNGNAVCECREKYLGDLCEIDKCALVKCQNGGTCDVRNRKTVCICNNKFTGDYCETGKE